MIYMHIIRIQGLSQRMCIECFNLLNTKPKNQILFANKFNNIWEKQGYNKQAYETRSNVIWL